MLSYTLHDEPQPEAEAVIDQGLVAFNASAAPGRLVAPLSCFARRADGTVVGGAVGRTSGQCGELELLWVASSARGMGVGAELVHRFEQRAIQRGCTIFSLSTFSFQARGFYERLGYHVGLEIPGHGPGASKYILLKETPTAAAAPDSFPMIDDVPTTVDFRRSQHAREWAESAMSLRPWRAEFFDAFASVIKEAPTTQGCRVLELGSGPGFLAQRLLESIPGLAYVAVDFSCAMHELAKERLGKLASCVQFVARNLRDPDWGEDLGQFDFAVTHQAVHELRHKRHAPALHSQVRQLVKPAGSYLVCDHFLGEGGMSNGQLYMTAEEQRQALLSAGFAQVEQLLLKGGLVLHRAT